MNIPIDYNKMIGETCLLNFDLSPGKRGYKGQVIKNFAATTSEDKGAKFTSLPKIRYIPFKMTPIGSKVKEER